MWVANPTGFLLLFRDMIQRFERRRAQGVEVTGVRSKGHSNDDLEGIIRLGAKCASRADLTCEWQPNWTYPFPAVGPRATTLANKFFPRAVIASHADIRSFSTPLGGLLVRPLK